ncbi:MAG: dihydroorotase [Gammaproteobacteria bacterium 28-57-27]|nr:MAG: dihydroorotase [Gammaproteobacteria bacterium 28-57-27]
MQITLTRPDDWHIHLRDNAMLKAVVPDVAREFARAIVMPNLVPPVLTTDDARAYRERILAAVPAGMLFDPLMTLYLTGQTTPAEITRAKQSGIVQAVKLYPAGATTNSDRGVTDMRAVYPVFEAMQKEGMVLCVHGEVVDADIDIFDREKVFIERVLAPLLRDFPELKVIMEHITTRDAADFVTAMPAHIGATITAHHLLYNRNAMLVGGIRPHFYCLPILKRETHRQALLAAAISGNPKFFLGTDSAPHPKGAKESSCGCAGCYTAHAAIELYAEAFEQAGTLDKLEGFASHFGADFYSLPRNTDHITLVKEDWAAPAVLEIEAGVELVPLRAGETLRWRIQ